MTRFIYKLLRAEEWDEFRESGKLAGSPDDLRDGFIHFSAQDQVKTTFDKYFSGVCNLELLAVDPTRLGTELKWEVSRGGQKFPHLYRALMLDEVHAAFAIGKDADGRPLFPPEIETMLHKGSCHCGAVAFEVEGDLTGGFVCDCSLCKRKGAIMARVPKEQFRLLKGADDLSTYQWNTMIARHYFCKHCGIYTHHQPRTVPDMMGVNLGCIDTIDARALPIKVGEGSKLSGGRDAI